MQNNPESQSFNFDTKEAGFSQAFLFLISCCQAERSEEEIEQITSYLNAKHTSVHKLADLSHQHGILPLIYKTLKDISSANQSGDWLSTEILPLFKEKYLSVTRQNMLLTTELVKVMKRLKENGIDALAFKGPVLSQAAYGDITLRQYGDLDILIPVDKLQDAAKDIMACGYDLYGSIDLLQVPEWIETTKDMTFMHAKKRTVIEMHWKLFQASFANASINLWEHTTTVPINNMPFTTLNNEVLLAYLAIHGSRHLWERIEWIVDLDRLVRNNRIDWEEVLHIAAKFNGKKMLLLGLYLSKLFFQTPLPSFIQKQTEAHNITSLAKEIMPLIETPITVEPTTKEVLKRKMLHAKMQDSLYGRYVFWKSVLFKPHYASVLEDEKNMSLFFKITKPFRLLKRVVFQQHA